MVSVPGPDSTVNRPAKRALAALAAAALLCTSACGVGGGEEKKKEGLAAGDYTVAAADDVRNSVVVNGNVGPIRSMSVTTALQSPVLRVAVGTGDRVSVDQFLLELDSSAAERQLEQQQAQQASAQADAVAAAQDAQAQLDAARDQINRGVHPAIAQAQAAVNQAQAAYDAAVAGEAPVKMDASANQIKRLLGQLGSGGGAPDPAPQPPAPAPAPAPAPEAQPAPAQLPQVDPAQEEAARQANIAQASAALQQAQAQLDAAYTQAAQERDALKRQADSAWRKADLAGTSEGDGSLEYQVQSATVTAPMAGLVTSVDVKEGDVPQGKLVTIADDSRLIIHTKVRESDIPNIANGNRVTFTSTATGDKEFQGRVSWISPVGSSDEVPVQGGGKKSDGAVMFPVDIEVTGDKAGLLLGGSARAEIITDEAPDALSVPLDAVFDDGGKKKVLVLAAGEGENRGTVEERVVDTGAENDVDVAVTGGELKPGEIVINWPDQYRDKVGEAVSITDPNFKPEDVAAARSGADKGGTSENKAR
ncbi:efflux RND transporter periplasmic adaptor subunit [Corynebacterium liangguodongii]|uniref:YknX-like beta-barrel domain-containing protein n=1 Tax=Corynebacterium liangguodongii TaxID=2079535 RepID=A0A2S0WEX8_9CORY|nr:efflux RND transporter periplasmic adaptor subunit [Corynebacterium liangguodongii]AWB84337.1 hypothetical protein C3E79_07455 [Corynebacterium liangguodongii]PWB99827.1 hypothetical protein DF219_04050 [Corynebacterium liangguodongii]